MVLFVLQVQSYRLLLFHHDRLTIQLILVVPEVLGLLFDPVNLFYGTNCHYRITHYMVFGYLPGFPGSPGIVGPDTPASPFSPSKPIRK